MCNISCGRSSSYSNNSFWEMHICFINNNISHSFAAGNCVSNSSCKLMRNTHKQFGRTRVDIFKRFFCLLTGVSGSMMSEFVQVMKVLQQDVQTLVSVHKSHVASSCKGLSLLKILGGGPRVSTAVFHARARGSVPGPGGLKETKNVSSPSTCEFQYCGEPPWPRGSVLGLRPPGL